MLEQLVCRICAVLHNSGTIPVLNVLLYKIDKGRANGVEHFFKKY
ncbi:unnamed protein product [Meloidogyne enterolobii]|uniref:Uncharacterized protein n=1 Tax=Meloidogyne enterolobii TaxID=390850 RepID=A0ACB0XRH0_MELEN